MTTNELCRRCRITHRQLQWWCDRGIIPHSRVRGWRDFTEDQVLTTAIVAQLRRKCISLPRIRKLRIGNPKGEYLVVPRAGRAAWCSTKGLIPYVAACPGPCLVVSVEDLRRLLDDKNTPRRSRRTRN